MPATIGALPLHPLLVHAVVVLVPLAVLAGIALAVSRWMRVRYGWLFVGLATLAVVSIPFATGAGEALAARVHMTPAIEQHTHMGEQLLPLVFVLWAGMLAVMLLHRWSTLPVDGPGTPPATMTRPPAVEHVDRLALKLRPRLRRRLAAVAAVITVLAAVASGIQCYRIGDSGARAVWHGVGTGPVVNHGDGDGDAG